MLALRGAAHELARHRACGTDSTAAAFQKDYEGENYEEQTTGPTLPVTSGIVDPSGSGTSCIW